MKSFLIAVLIMFASSDSFASLITLNCEDEIALTLTSDKNEGTISLLSGKSVSVWPLKKKQTTPNSTIYSAAIPMVLLTVEISKPTDDDGFKYYDVKVVTESEGNESTKNLECTSIN